MRRLAHSLLIVTACCLIWFVSCEQNDKPRQGEGPLRVFIADVRSDTAPLPHADTDSEGASRKIDERRLDLGLMKTLQQTCPDLHVTLDEAFVDIMMLVEKTAAEGPERVRYRVAAFDSSKEMIHNDSAPSLEKAIADACTTIRAASKSRGQGR